MDVATATVINDRTRGFVIRPVSTGERLLARLRAGSLDRQLATGNSAGNRLAAGVARRRDRTPGHAK